MSNRASARRSSGGILLPGILLLTLGTTSVHATRVRSVNLEDMVQSAARIWSGRCVEVRVVNDSALNRPVTLVTLEVDRALKGPSERTVTIRMAGGLGQDGRSTVAGMPRFQRGEEIILFVYGESRSGLTSPVGLGQGKFRIHKDAQGRRLAVNEGANESLFKGLSQRAVERLKGAAERWKGRGGIPPGALLSMVEALQHEQAP